MNDLLSENTLRVAVFMLVRVTETAAALVIFFGAAFGFGRFVFASVAQRSIASFTPVRLDLGRFLALGLEFQLASDLLRTAVAPTFEEIGKLAAVAAIRTALNFFLSREIRAESEEMERRGQGAPR